MYIHPQSKHLHLKFGVAIFAISSLVLVGCGGGGSSAQTSQGTATYTVGGSVSGLPVGTSVVLQNNAGDNRTVSINGTFTFATSVATATIYSVTVLTQPASATCSVANGSGTVGSVAINNVNVSCSVIATTPTTASAVTTIAGTLTAGSMNGTGTAAGFNRPAGLTVDSSGNLYVSETGNNLIRKITPAGVVTTLAGSVGTPGAVNGTGTAASFSSSPYGVAVDAAGNVFVADSGNNMIRMITSAGVVTTLAGSATAGSLDGTGTAASFNRPSGVAVDSAGNVFVADSGNNMIRKITQAGVVTTLAGSAASAGAVNGTGTAASFLRPFGLAVDTLGNAYVGDSGNRLIRKITSAGVVTTLAGGNLSAVDGTGTAAGFFGPGSLAVDATGNIYVTDTYCVSSGGCFTTPKIRKVTPAGVVTTFAGTGSLGSANGTGATATFNFPLGIAVDSANFVYVADMMNNVIRKITP
jgi:serine/threonine-protein kinase